MLFPKYTGLVPGVIEWTLNRLSDELSESMKVRYVGHGAISSTGVHTGYFSNNKWRDYYFGSNTISRDPMLRLFKNNNNDFILWNDERFFAKEKEALSIRHEICKTGCGITIKTPVIYNHHMYNEYFYLGLDMDPKDLLHLAANEYDYLKILAYTFSEKHTRARAFCDMNIIPFTCTQAVHTII